MRRASMLIAAGLLVCLPIFAHGGKQGGQKGGYGGGHIPAHGPAPAPRAPAGGGAEHRQRRQRQLPKITHRITAHLQILRGNTAQLRTPV